MINEIKKSIEYRSLAMIGSRARGDYGPHSDWDYIAICDSSGFHRVVIDTCIVEIHTVTCATDYENKPSWWYALKCAKYINGDPKPIDLLREFAVDKINKYRTETKIMNSNIEWLQATKRKLLNSKNRIESEFQMSSAIWELLSSYFHRLGKPVPANGDMLREISLIADTNEINELFTLPWKMRKKLYIKIIDRQCAQ